MAHKDEGVSALCLTKTRLITELLEWWSTNIFALQASIPAIMFIRIPDFKELLVVPPTEFGKGLVGASGSAGSPGCFLGFPTWDAPL